MATTSVTFRDNSIRRSVPLPSSLKERLRFWPPVQRTWESYRVQQTMREYHRRREHYAAQAEARGLSYVEAEVVSAIRQRLRARGYTPARRAPGEVHTFACVPGFGWHDQLVSELRELGPVTHFDCVALGYRWEEVFRGDRAASSRREEMLAQLLPRLREAHARRPVDWVFCYGGGQDTSPALIRRISDELGIPTANISLDDKQGWAGPSVGECRTGQVDITAAFDLFATSATIACEWHMVEGGRPIYMPEGFAAQAFPFRDTPRDIPISFVGLAYGYRIGAIQYLRRHGIPVQTFGRGWRDAAWAADLGEVFSRSRINLGMGGIVELEGITNVKARDFEVPATGGGLYLTSYNPDLARHFVVGQEIACYGNREEMLELLRYYQQHDDEARAIAQRGRARCLREHRWRHRFEKMLRILEILPPMEEPA